MSTPRRRRKDQPLNQEVGTLATVPIATGDIPNLIESFARESLAREPTHDEIARRAYQLYEERGGEHGREWRTGSRRSVSCDGSRCSRSSIGSSLRADHMPPLESLVARVRGEYHEMPGLRLTFAQACRLWQIEAPTCKIVLEQLVREGFLDETQDGAYIALSATAGRTQLRERVA